MRGQAVKTCIKLLCCCEDGSTELPELFSGRSGWEVILAGGAADMGGADTLAPAVVIIQGFRRSVEEICGLILSCTECRNRNRPVILVAFAGDPGMASRKSVLEAGADDWFAMPVSFSEFDMKARLHLEKRETAKLLAWNDKRYRRLFSYLERFKEGLVKTRKKLAGERRLLNNSLKQVNAMTREREALKHTIQELNDRLKADRLGMESLLAGLIESRNEGNKGHASRVAEIALFVAEGLGLKDPEMNRIKRAALLHEFGMLFIPGSVYYKKQGELTEHEEDLFRHQASKGAAILGQCHALAGLADILKGLGEWVDGSGFPDGLKRRYIPLGTRIIAGADLLDDLMEMESRPEALLESLEALAGTRLDPRVVNLLGHYVVIRRESHSIKEVGLYQIQPGMKTGAGIFTATGTKLLAAGTTLTQDIINMIMRYNREYPLEETVFIRAD